MKKFVFLIFLLILIISCFNKENDNSYVLLKDSNDHNMIQDEENILPINKQKLELFVGKNFNIVFHKILNLDTDIDDELLLATEEKNKNVKIYIFDLLPNEDLDLKYSFMTKVFYNKDFNLQTQNLFEADDIGVIMEGKSGDSKNLLYLFLFIEDEYELIGEFFGDFSVLTEFEEVDPGIDKQKYIALSEIITINNMLSATNTNLHEKKIYKWDKSINKFIILEESQVKYSTISSVDNSMIKTKESFFHYISGFWYPIEYLNLINSDSFDITKIDNSQIRFILFSENVNEVAIKMDEYITKYKITKTLKLWGNKPKLRLKISGFSTLNSTSYKKIDISLISSSKIQTKGPGKFDVWTFVRLQKPFIEYLNSKKASLHKKNIDAITSSIKGNYEFENKFTINFADNKFIISDIIGEIQKEFGIFQLLYFQNKYIINFIFENENTMLKNELFIFDMSKGQISFSLIPVRFGINGVIINNLKSIVCTNVDRAL